MTNPRTRPTAITPPLFDLPRDLPDVPFAVPVVLVSVARAVGFSVGTEGNCKPGGAAAADELAGVDNGGGDDVEVGGVMEEFEEGAGGGGVSC